jgi:hypothetical protein
MEEMHLATPFLLAECRNQRLQLRACRVNVVAIQCVGFPLRIEMRDRLKDWRRLCAHDSLSAKQCGVFAGSILGSKLSLCVY